MNIGKSLFGLSLAALMATAATAAAPAVKAGAPVFDPAGGTVGTVESVQGDVATVSTGTAKAGLGISSFTTGPKGLVIGMTRAQLETAAADASAKAAAELKALLTPGATVYGSDGTVAATVDSADAQFATVNVGAMKAKLPLNAFTKGAQGVTIGITSAALKAAVDSQASAQATPAAPAGNAAKPR